MRRKGLQVSPSALPSRHNRKPPRKVEPPAWNRQIVGEHRAGGTFMPYLHPDGEPYRNKEFAEHRRKLTETRRAQRADPQGATDG